MADVNLATHGQVLSGTLQAISHAVTLPSASVVKSIPSSRSATHLALPPQNTTGQIIHSAPDSVSTTPKLSPQSQTDDERVQAIQKLQFHDFPLTTAAVTCQPSSSQITQAKILTDKQIDFSKIQSLHEQGGIKVSVSQTGITKGSCISSASPVGSTIVTFTSVTKPSVTTDVSEQAPTTSISIGSFLSGSGKPKEASSTTSSTLNFTVSGPKDTAGLVQRLSATESLGRVSSLMESSKSSGATVHILKTLPVTGDIKDQESKQSEVPETRPDGESCDAFSSNAPDSESSKAATRTRKIKTPKQFD